MRGVLHPRQALARGAVFWITLGWWTAGTLPVDIGWPMNRDELPDIGQKNQIWPRFTFCLDHTIKPSKGVVVAFPEGQVWSDKVGQQRVSRRLAIPTVVFLREQNERIAEMFGPFAK